jgi:hypothetical protein
MNWSATFPIEVKISSVPTQSGRRRRRHGRVLCTYFLTAFAGMFLLKGIVIPGDSAAEPVLWFGFS